MAEGEYHQNIKKGLLSLAKSKGYEEGSPKYAKLPIRHPTQHSLWFEYIPDFWINSTRPGEMFIFEIFYDELEDPDKIIADLLQCYLVHILTNIKKKIIFIVPTSRGAEKVSLHCNIVQSCLIKKGIAAKKLPDPLIYTISEIEAKKSDILSKILEDYSKQDGWASLGEK